jgi:D-arabinose 1-dehydrogenase-like Zn-dependent alcohol dehydrogenase
MTAVRPRFHFSAQDGGMETLLAPPAFAADGRVKADIELQPLAAVNDVLARLAHGDVPARVVLDFSSVVGA